MRERDRETKTDRYTGRQNMNVLWKDFRKGKREK